MGSEEVLFISTFKLCALMCLTSRFRQAGKLNTPIIK